MEVASGEQVELRRHAARAVVTEVGATLRLYEADGRAVVDGFAAGEMCPASHGQVLAPWPNRIDGGRYRAPDGAEQQLPITEPARGNAVHGLVNWLPWGVVARADDEATLQCELHPRPGYPFHLRLHAHYGLSDDGLQCTVDATNAGDRAAPYGIGHHPYIACPHDRVDNALLRVPAAAVLETDGRMIPTGAMRDVDGTPFDFREERAVGATVLDHCYTRLQPDADGVIRVSVGDGATWRTTVWMQAPFRWLMVFTGDPLQPPRHRRAVAVEPMTCPPNAFRSGEDLAVLRPGESLRTAWGIAPQRLD
jgi:aldose 1-epimerase